MAGTVVDALLEGVAGATTGIGTGTPKTGGILNVALSSDDPPASTFTGSTGKLDAAGFCIANAVYDLLFNTSANGKDILPCLGTTITGSNKYQTWKVNLRQNVKFHDGTAFNAAAVVANYKAAAANLTVGQAINPLIKNCVATGTYAVEYTMVLPFYSFPYALSESQIGYMANPKMFANGYAGNPNGTGPFKFSSWTPQVESSWIKNGSYWRKDSAGRALPYLAQINFKTIANPASRVTAIKTNTVQLAIFSDGPSILSVEHDSSLVYLSSITQNKLIAPAMNFAMCNVNSVNVAGVAGHFDTGTSKWVAGTKSPISNVLVREALAYSINTAGYLAAIDSGVGQTSNGIFVSGNAYYKNPGYPTYNVTTAKAKIAAYKAQTHLGNPTIVVHTLNTATADDQFAYLQRNAAAAGITLVQFAVNDQSQYVDTYGVGRAYEIILWSQFGGLQEAFPLNYVWWDSSLLNTGKFAPGFKSEFGHNSYAGTVNFAGNIDGDIESAMVAALGASTATAQTKNWQTVNNRFAIDIPYLWLDITVNVWAAQKTVENWAGAMAASATSVDSKTGVLTPDGGTLGWAQIWLS